MKSRYGYAVIKLRQFTDSQVGSPDLYARKSDAEDSARAFNRSNQDHTWNAIVAYAVPVQELQCS